MRAAHLVARSLLAGVLGCGLAAALPTAAHADDDDLQVSAEGVAFSERRNDRDAEVGYSVRSLEGWHYEWFTTPVPEGESGYVAFGGAVEAMPDGYCVTYVHVPGVGSWSDDDGACTPVEQTASPSPAPTAKASPSASPTASPSPKPSAKPKKPEPTAKASPTPTPTPAPTPTPSASPSPSPSPSPSRSPKPSPSPSPSRAGAVPAVVKPSYAPVPEIDTGDAHVLGFLDDGDLWAASGLVLAAAGIAAGGVVIWRMRRTGG